MGPQDQIHNLSGQDHYQRVHGVWWRVEWHNKEGWLQGQDSLTGQPWPCLHSVTSYRLFEAWRGAHTFWCRGRVMLGPDSKAFICSNVLILLPALTFLIWIAPSLPTLIARFVVEVLAGCLIMSSMYFLWRTALSDPGIIPALPAHVRPAPPTSPTHDVAPLPCPVEVSTMTRDLREGQERDLRSREGQLHGWRYCETCNVYRPPRAKHCRSCNCCVERMDHHCIWVGTCVAKRNYRSFVLFVLTTTVLSVFVFATCLAVVVRHLLHSPEPVQALWMVAGEFPAAAGVGVFTFVMSWSLASLCSYHIYLIATAQTTNEALRRPSRGRENEFNQGFWQNCVNVWTEDVGGSRLPATFHRKVCVEAWHKRGARPGWECPESCKETKERGGSGEEGRQDLQGQNDEGFSGDGDRCHLLSTEDVGS